MGLRNKLKLLATEIQHKKFKDINYGGCGFFASVIAEELTKRNIQHEITILCFDDAECFWEEMEERDMYYSCISHVVIKLTDDEGIFFFDSDGVAKAIKDEDHVLIERWMELCVVSTVSHNLLRRLNNFAHWNAMYDTKQNERLQLTVKHWFVDYIDNIEVVA